MTPCLGTPIRSPCKSLNKARGTGLLGLILFLVGGCADYPHARGEWRGRTEAIRVYDLKGNAYEAIALHIVSGPPLPRNGRGFRTNGPPSARERATDPLLLRRDDRILQPGEVPIGAVVRVRGDMSHFNSSDPKNVWLVTRIQGGSFPEKAIRLRGDVKVIEPPRESE